MRPDLMHSLLRNPSRFGIVQDCLFCARMLSDSEWGLCDLCHHDLRLPEIACALCLLPLDNRPADATFAPLICGQCIKQPPAFDRCSISTLYQPPISHIIARYKYSASFHCGRLLAKLMADEIIANPAAQLPSAIVPVPLHWSRQLSRGFNQTTLLATQVRSRLRRHYRLHRKAIPVASHLLKRHAQAQSQVTQGVRGRKTNVQDAFELRSGVTLPGSVAIVDDVVTTGATVNEIARLLKRAGVQRVEVWAAARTP